MTQEHAEKLYRPMQTCGDGRPLVGTDNYMLGARIGIDVRPDSEGNVGPGGGLSVTPGNPARLPPHLRPESLGGTGRLPVFVLLASQLGDGLAYVPDSKRPDRHGTVEPAETMPLAGYQKLLADTRDTWDTWRQEA